MYCSHCGNKIPDNSKFCNECGCVVYDSREPQININNQSNYVYSNSFNNNATQHSIHTEIKEQSAMNDYVQVTEDIPMPKLSKAFWLFGAIGVLSFLYLWSAIGKFDEVFILDFIVMLVLFGVCVFVCFGTMYVFISDYTLSKKDFEKYKAKYIKFKEHEKKYAKTLKESEEVREKERKELEMKRAEYKTKGIASCPNCGSTSIATINRGYSIISGFIGSGKPVNVCQICGYKWRIGR